MRRIASVAAVTAMLALSLACAPDTTKSPKLDQAAPKAPAVLPASPRDASQVLYERHCAACHGQDLRGSTGPGLLESSFRNGFVTALDLLRYLTATMPQNAPGSLSQNEYLRVIEVILAARGIPFEPPLLESEALRILIAEDAEAVPTIAPTPLAIGPPASWEATVPRHPPVAEIPQVDAPFIYEPRPGPRGTVSPYFLRFAVDPPTDGSTTWTGVEYEVRDARSHGVVWTARVEDRRGWADLRSGAFVGSLAGRMGLLMGETYRVRARMTRAPTATGAWSPPWPIIVAPGTGGEAPHPYPLRVADAQAGSLQWTGPDGNPIELPAGAGTPPELRSITRDGLLFAVSGTSSDGNAVHDAAPLQQLGPVFIQISAGDVEVLPVPDSTLSFRDEIGRSHRIDLPGLALGGGQTILLSASANGGTFWESDTTLEREKREPAQQTVARHPAQAWLTRPGFRAERVNTGLLFPVNIDFVPDPAGGDDAVVAYVTELFGRVLALDRWGHWHVFAEGLLNYDPRSAPQSLEGQNGVSGIAVDPVSGWVYVSLVILEGDELFNRIVRIEPTDGGRAAGDIETVLTMGPDPTSHSHQVHELTFGPDGKLYVNVGNAFSGRQSQSPTSFNGKILRLNPDGSAPADNPWFDPSNPASARSYQFATGIRNAFGADWRGADGVLYISENGDVLDRVARVDPGTNLGYDGTDASLVPDALVIFGPPAVAPTGIAALNSHAFPAVYSDCLFVATGGQSFRRGPQSAGKRIWVVTIDAQGAVNEPLLEFAAYVGNGRSSISGLAFGPDGLYFLDLFPEYPAGGNPAAPESNLWRIVAEEDSVASIGGQVAGDSRP